MKFSINVTKTHLILLSSLFLILAVGIFVIAENAEIPIWQNPNPAVWHSGDAIKVNIEGKDYNLQTAIDNGLLGGGGINWEGKVFSLNFPKAVAEGNEDEIKDLNSMVYAGGVDTGKFGLEVLEDLRDKLSSNNALNKIIGDEITTCEEKYAVYKNSVETGGVEVSNEVIYEALCYKGGDLNTAQKNYVVLDGDWKPVFSDSDSYKRRLFWYDGLVNKKEVYHFDDFAGAKKKDMFQYEVRLNDEGKIELRVSDYSEGENCKKKIRLAGVGVSNFRDVITPETRPAVLATCLGSAGIRLAGLSGMSLMLTPTPQNLVVGGLAGISATGSGVSALASCPFVFKIINADDIRFVPMFETYTDCEEESKQLCPINKYTKITKKVVGKDTETLYQAQWREVNCVFKEFGVYTDQVTISD
ncbi:MAG: hypothetical protein WC533_00750 [Candidatus Pacearchaeota archaeon]